MQTSELRVAAWAIFLATDEKVAQDISDKLKGAADEIDKLRRELTASQNQTKLCRFLGWMDRNTY